VRENPEIVWEMYQLLEKDFLNYLDYVPLDPQHYNVWSYPLGNLLNNIGSCVDSFFKNAIYCESLDDYSDITDLRQRDHHNMGTYRTIFETQYKISDKKIFDLKTYSPIIPFSEWKTDNPPDWWNKYTDIKHDRFRNKEKATLKATLDALGALFVLFLTHKETLYVLIDNDVIIRNGYPKERCKEDLPQIELTDQLLNRIYAKTDLFGYVFNSKRNCNSDELKIKILSPGYPGYG
jgi:hypothetical protein